MLRLPPYLQTSCVSVANSHQKSVSGSPGAVTGVVAAPVLRSNTLAAVDLPGPATSITTLSPEGEIATWVAAGREPNSFASSVRVAACTAADNAHSATPAAPDHKFR